MLVLLIYLINISRATILYISNNLISKMSRHFDSQQSIQPNSSDKIDDDDKTDDKVNDAPPSFSTLTDSFHKQERDQVQEVSASENVAPEIDASEGDSNDCLGKPQESDLKKNTVGKNCTGIDGLGSPKIMRKKSSRKKSSSDRSQPNTSKKQNMTDGPNMTSSKVIQFPKYTESEDDEIVTFPADKDSSVYPMNSKRRGKCVIFNHTEFDEDVAPKREGSNTDRDTIDETFSLMGFEVVVHSNLEDLEIEHVIGELTMEDYSDCDCICVFILSHGTTNNLIYAKDGFYLFHNIWRPFINCRTLAGKPKMFFVQACKGSFVDVGIKGRSATDFVESSYTIPTHADFLFGYSTVEGFCSFREETGTWYIQSLCKTIKKHWKDTDVLKILTITARQVAYEYTSKHDLAIKNNKKQMPSLTSTLTRDLYFAPQDTA